MDETNIDDKLWDYLCCLENAIKVIYKRVKVNTQGEPVEILMHNEIEILTRVEKDLKRIIDDENNKTYWDYWNVGEDND